MVEDAPVGPVRPLGPVVFDVGPVGPVICGPVHPVGPLIVDAAPVDPVAPVAPVGPVTPAGMSCSSTVMNTCAAPDKLRGCPEFVESRTPRVRVCADWL